jgi:hypothetical protein
MAIRRARGRARSKRRMANEGRTTKRAAASGGLNASMVPGVLLGAVDGVGIVAVGALQFARDVLLTVVSGAANVGAEALTATVTGTRGIVSATSQTVADIAGTAQRTFLTTVNNVRHPRRGPARLAPGYPATPMTGEAGEEMTAAPSTDGSRPRRRARRPRLVKQPARASMAA